MIHSEFSTDAIVARFLEFSDTQYTLETSSIEVEGIYGKSTVEVTDRVSSVAARALYTGHDCRECRQRFLQVISDHRDLIALSISCEHIIFNSDTKNFELYKRVDAALATQKVYQAPAAYLGPYEHLVEVQQRQFAISSAASEKPILATWHLATCIAFFGFEPKTRHGFLFHFDDESNIRAAVNALKSNFSENEVQYRFIGGADDKEARERRIERLLPSNFKKRAFPAAETISTEVLNTDSFWSRSCRLLRSVALDLRKEDPLADIQGYEPLINPDSSFHKRAHTQDEANSFSANTSSLMKCVYSLGK